MAKACRYNFIIYTIVWFILLIAPFSYCIKSCDAWGMPFVSLVMLIAAIPVGIVDIIFTIAGYPISSKLLFNAALILSYFMVFSMALALGFYSKDLLEALKGKFKLNSSK